MKGYFGDRVSNWSAGEHEPIWKRPSCESKLGQHADQPKMLWRYPDDDDDDDGDDDDYDDDGPPSFPIYWL